MPISTYLARLRAHIGHDLVLTPAAIAAIHDAEGRVLLMRASDSKAWSLPGGAIDPGESPAAAVRREVFEETGLHVTPTTLLAVFGGLEHRYTYPNEDVVEYTTLLFRCAIDGGELEARDGEAEELVWVDPDELPALAVPYPARFLHADYDGPTHFDPA